MKVTRVLLAATDNPIYYQFWNPVSRVYAEKFGIKPTLIWIGKAEDIDRLELRSDHGNIIVQEPDPRFDIGWQSAWSIFYFMKLYPDDVFCTMGIDQVPLSPILIRDIPNNVSDDAYLMLADDAYMPSHWIKQGGTSPTSFHIVKGSIACKVYGFEETFKSEIEKIESSGIRAYYHEGGANWGLDESYSSHKLREYAKKIGNVISKNIFSTICARRIECCRTQETPYDMNLLTQNWYGDAHLCRPFSDHKNYIETLFDNIPKSI